jgi:hypothetical protein
VLDVSDAATKVVIAANGNVAWTDVSIQARVKIVSFSGSSSSYYAGPCVRVLDADNYYCASLRSDGKVSIRGNVAGSGGALTGMTPSSSSSSSYSISPAITTGTWYTVKMTVVGPTITLYVNGALVFTVTDTGIAAGGVGLAINDGEAVFDDVVVTKP